MSEVPVNGFISVSDQAANLMIVASSQREVIRIDPEGRIFWNGREIESDADFRAAMIEVAALLNAARKG